MYHVILQKKTPSTYTGVTVLGIDIKFHFAVQYLPPWYYTTLL